MFNSVSGKMRIMGMMKGEIWATTDMEELITQMKNQTVK